MSELETKINKIKESLRGLLDENTPQDTIDSITKIDESLDELAKTATKVKEENQGLKSKIVDMVKATSFKPLETDQIDPNPTEPMSLDEIIALESAKLNK